MKKKLLVFVVGVLLLYCMSFLLLGKNALVNSISKDTHSSYQEFHWTKQVVLISNMNIDEKNVQTLNHILGTKDLCFTLVKIKSYDDAPAELFKQQDTYQYILMADAHYLPWVAIEEVERISEYVLVYKIKYVWFFFKWIKMEDEQLLIS